MGHILAESTDCTAPVLIIADGRTAQSSLPKNTTSWYGIYTQANHSYSVEFVPPADNYFNYNRPVFNGISVYSPSDSFQMCRGNSSVAVTPNIGILRWFLRAETARPKLRVSFTVT